LLEGTPESSQQALETPPRLTTYERLAKLLGVSNTERPASRQNDRRTRDDEDDENNEAQEMTPNRNDEGEETYYPCYQWEESEEQLEGTTSRLATKAMMPTASGHATTRIRGKEGIVLDTGAVKSLTGSRFVRAQGEIARQNGAEVKWYQLDTPKRVGGIGSREEVCRYNALVPGRLADGEPMECIASVVQKDEN
jgi:hypothetical protein